jgi:hypothetical protein
VSTDCVIDASAGPVVRHLPPPASPPEGWKPTPKVGEAPWFSFVPVQRVGVGPDGLTFVEGQDLAAAWVGPEPPPGWVLRGVFWLAPDGPEGAAQAFLDEHRAAIEAVVERQKGSA